MYRNFFYKHLRRAAVTISVCFTALIVTPGTVAAHGFAGSRFFPATLSTDDPFVNDELSLPTVSSIVTPEEGGTRDTEISLIFEKRLRQTLGMKAGRALTIFNPRADPR